MFLCHLLRARKEKFYPFCYLLGPSYWITFQFLQTILNYSFLGYFLFCFRATSDNTQEVTPGSMISIRDAGD